MISADIKTNVKQEIKELVAVSYNFAQTSQNLERNVKKACIFHLTLIDIRTSLTA